MATPVFITVRDRLTPLVQLVGWLERDAGTDITLVDNDSAYPPLLDWLDRCGHRVVHTGSNLGPRAAWLTGLVQQVGLTSPYIVTDPDVVPDDDCPLDLIEHLVQVLASHPQVDRVGPGLRIDDLPPGGEHTEAVLAWESQFWDREIGPGLFAADIDTTFALYRPGRRTPGAPALRTGPPYVARHLPWYQVGPPDEEVLFYRARADPTVNSWDFEDLPPYLRELIIERDGPGPVSGRQ